MSWKRDVECVVLWLSESSKIGGARSTVHSSEWSRMSRSSR